MTDFRSATIKRPIINKSYFEIVYGQVYEIATFVRKLEIQYFLWRFNKFIIGNYWLFHMAVLTRTTAAVNIYIPEVYIRMPFNLNNLYYIYFEKKDFFSERNIGST